MKRGSIETQESGDTDSSSGSSGGLMMLLRNLSNAFRSPGPLSNRFLASKAREQSIARECMDQRTRSIAAQHGAHHAHDRQPGLGATGNDTVPPIIAGQDPPVTR